MSGEMNEEKPDFLTLIIALRDCYATAVEAIDVYLKTRAPPGVNAEKFVVSTVGTVKHLTDKTGGLARAAQEP